MGWIDQIDIFRAGIDQFLKYADQFFFAHCHAFVFQTDLAVLAKYAFQITAAEKDGAAAVFAAYAGLLPKMQRRPCNAKTAWRIAKAGFFIPVYPAGARAHFTDHSSSL